MLACWHAGTFACCYVGISSRFPTAVGLAVRNNRHEHRRFFFSHVHNPFQQCLADFRRPERFDTESEGGYRFEVVNLRAVSVRYADNALYVIYTQNSAFAECLYPCPNRRGDNPEQFADFPLGHGGCAYIARQGDIALPVHRDNVPFFFHRYSALN